VEFSVEDTKLPNETALIDRLGNVRDARVTNRTVKLEIPAHSSAILTTR